MDFPLEVENSLGLDLTSPQNADLMSVLESYLEQLDRGQAPDPERLIAQHPEMAAELPAYLQKLDLLHCASTQLRRTPEAGELLPAEPEPELVQLGDFTILREIGRGGMGIVYEAAQRSLGRRVALKVLPFAAALNAKQLERFRHEAEAAARLQHPNIVPVYAVGCERGIHYYVMQFIEGTTLAGLIEEMRQEKEGQDRIQSTVLDGQANGAQATTLDFLVESRQHKPLHPFVAFLKASSAFFQAAAQLGIQAAEALEHAHQLGVVHRDVKPANVLVDLHGNVWLTDFGLARFQTESDLTRSGDRVGTLRYMSPEQASAKRGLIDQRTDVYSLGATLYEVVTRKPAFPGDDPHEILSQIASQEPRRPRSIDPAIPLELETIILKAMAKSPTERYGTAQEFAADLRRFLDDQPILARRPGLAQRMRKWARRHKAWVTAGFAATVIALLASAAGTCLIWMAQQDALRARDSARDNERMARGEKERAEKNLDLAVQALLDLLTVTETVAEQSSLDARTQADVQKLLKKVVAAYDTFAQENHMTPQARWLKAMAYRRVGDIHQRLLQAEAAEAAYRSAVSLFEQLAAEFPKHAGYREDLASCLCNLGRMQRVGGQLNKAETTIGKALALLAPLASAAAAGPSCGSELAGCYHELGLCLKTRGKITEAIQAYRKGLEALPQAKPDETPDTVFRSRRASNLMDLGVVLELSGKFAEAEQVYRETLAVRRQLAAEHPTNREFKYQWAAAHHNLAHLLSITRRLSEAETAQRQGLKLLEGLATECPSVPSFRKDLAAVSANLASYLEALNRPEEALVAFARAVELLEPLARDFSAIPDFRKLLALVLNNQAPLLSRNGRRPEAIAAYRRAISLWDDLAKAGHREPEYLQATAACLHNLAVLLQSNTATLEEAHDLVKQAIRLQNEALQADPHSVISRNGLALHRTLLADIVKKLGPPRAPSTTPINE